MVSSRYPLTHLDIQISDRHDISFCKYYFTLQNETWKLGDFGLLFAGGWHQEPGKIGPMVNVL